MRKETFRMFRVRADLCARINDLVEQLNIPISANGLVETMLEQFIELVDRPPDQRTIPPLVSMLDDAKARRKSAGQFMTLEPQRATAQAPLPPPPRSSASEALKR